MTYLFDTSALLVFYFDEAGANEVSGLLKGGRGQSAVCCITAIEFWSRLKHLGAADRYPSEWAEIEAMVCVLPVNDEVVNLGLDIRRACDQRIPTVDLLIAATAVNSGLTLVHRDPHFLAIPKKVLQQQYLGSTFGD